MRRWRRFGSGLARGLLLVALVVLLLVVAGLVLLQTSWSREQLRSLIVTQANHYLTATLSIGRLSGSLVRGIELDDVRLARGDATLVAIDRVTVAYSIRELVSNGTVIRSLSLDRPRIVAAREPDGRWNLGALIRRDTQRNQRTGPGRRIVISSIDINEGSVSLLDPLAFGAAHVPSRFEHLNTHFSFAYQPVTWTLDFAEASFSGTEPDLTVSRLSGAVSDGDEGWLFSKLQVVTPRSEFSLDGRIDRRQTPTALDLTVAAPRFAFQEWSGVLHGLSNIAVESGFDARLSGPPAAMATKITLRSNGGDVSGDLVLDTTVPGWHAKGAATVQRLDLARWLNRHEQHSDISGAVDLDIDLQLGFHFPRGAFTFRGPHAAYLDYEGDDIVARGTITPSEVRIASATATAYGANVRLTSSTLAIDAPYAFHFVGRADGVDLRQVPKTVPVPHVESTLALDYDVVGQFTAAFIRGRATFADSEFLNARIAPGATGFIDTQATPFHYQGEGELSGVDLNHFGDRLQIGWLTDPKYAGSVRGRFHVDGTGSDLSTMVLNGGGRLEEANLFDGRLRQADVSIAIANGSLEGSYDGELVHIDPSIPMGDPLYSAHLSGHGTGRVRVHDLLVRSPELNDYTVDATLAVNESVVRGIQVSHGDVQASITDGTLHINRLVTTGPGVDVDATGTLELDGVRSSRISYNVTRSDLAKLKDLLGRDVAGQATTNGTLTGPLDRMRFAGEATLDHLVATGIESNTNRGTYDVTIPTDNPTQAVGTIKGQHGEVSAFGQQLQTLQTDITYDAGRVTASLAAVVREGVEASLNGQFGLDLDARRIEVDALSLTALRTAWELYSGSRPILTWTDTGVGIEGLDLVDPPSRGQHLTASGTWDSATPGRMQFAARGVSIDNISMAEGTSLYGGVVDGTAELSGTRERPLVSADFRVTQGRVRRTNYERLAGHIDYSGGMFRIDARLDQTANVFLTAVGTVPMGVFDRTLPPQPLQLKVQSSDVSLTLVEGITNVVRNVTGQMRLDISIVGTSSDPHFVGQVNLSNAGFDVVSSGARYRNGRLAVTLSPERVVVDALHLEDEDKHPLDVTGSLGTHELQIGELQVDINAKGFQVLRNEYGRVDVDARLNLAGQFESPLLTGRITVASGSLNVDRILDRTLFQPYSTQEASLPEVDPIAALNPWDRVGLNLEVHVPGTLRMVGENVQVTPGTPLGLGDISVRAFGDLYLYKDPKQPMYVNGSFDSLSGTYAFQGRRFDLDPSSSINFRSDLNPELYITVSRVISSVETRVSIVGPLHQPELRLASTPPLEPSDILSLIVFNTSTNELSAMQQQQLAVRAGTLAAGFLAAPMVSALERTLGIDTLEIEPSDVGGGARVTVGNEIAPGLVARFSRQFGEADYDEATVEYYLSRLFRIRATFSDASSLTARSPFRRVERAGVDLLLFFSF